MARVPIPLSANYASTQTDVDMQRRVNLYPHSDGGFRQFPGEISVFSITGAAYASKSYNTSGKDFFYIRPNGTAFYTADVANNTIYQSNMTAWDISTVGSSTANQAFSTEPTAASVSSFTFKSDDGTKVYVFDYIAKILYQYTLSSAWTISSASYDTKSLDLSAIAVGAYSGFYWKSDGSSLFVASDSAQKVYEYGSGTAWDISTFSAVANSGTSITVAVRQIDFSSDGYILFCGTDTGVTQYALTTAWDLTTIVDSASFSWTEANHLLVGFQLGDSGSKMYQMNYSVAAARVIYEYTLVDAYNASTMGTERGATVMGGDVYAVIGTNLFKITDSSGTYTRLGTIVGTQRVIMDTDGTQLVITEGAHKYLYTVSGGLASITDGDLGDADTNAYLDSRFWFENTGGVVIGSDINAASSINALYFVTAESFTDGVTRVLSANELLYFFGSSSIEVWYSSGVGIPPIDRQAVITKVGIIGRYAVAVIENVIYFMDGHRHLNAMVGAQVTPIRHFGMDKEIGGYTTVDDCIFNAYTIDREHFVEMNFPTAGTSWTYHIDSGQISKREDTSNNQFNCTTYVNAFGLTLGFDATAGKGYKFSTTTYQDDGNNITRTLDTGVVDSELLQLPARKMICRALVLTFEASTTAAISISLSRDGAAFETARSITLNAGVQQVKLPRWGRFTQGIFRITTTANALVDILKAEADLEPLSV